MALAHPIPVPAARFLLQPLTGGRVRDIALVLGATGFLALMAQVAMPVPGSPVPVTGQTLAVLVVGATLGTGRGGSGRRAEEHTSELQSRGHLVGRLLREQR